MSFMKELEKINNNETMTTNGDKAYKSTLNHNLDFFFAMGNFYQYDKVKILEMFNKAYKENPILAIQNLFFLRDYKNGIGLRDSFVFCLRNVDDKYIVKLLPYIVEYGRWDDVIKLLLPSSYNLNFSTLEEIKEFIKKQLIEDAKNMSENRPISLLAKWMPSCNASSYDSKVLSKILMKYLGLKEKEYRKFLKSLRRYIDIVEPKIVEKRFSDIDYSKIPSKAMLKYSSLFQYKDYERFEEFKKLIANDNSLMTKKVEKLFPYEIIKKLNRDRGFANSLWDSLEKESLNKKILVVRDGSYSMYDFDKGFVRPIDIADSLSIYCSERLTGEFKDKFVTFSRLPKLVDLSNNYTLSEKFDTLKKYDEAESTNIESVYNLILETSLNCKPEDYLDTILIISDMEFNQCSTGADKSTLDSMREKFKSHNIPMPNIVFWNVNASRIVLPTMNLDGIVLVSGMSKNLFKEISNGELSNAKNFMIKSVSRYSFVFEIFVDYIKEQVEKNKKEIKEVKDSLIVNKAITKLLKHS